MAWNIRANFVESCSCALLCPCTLGPAKPDQGWCSAVLGVQVLEGDSDGVDLSGAKVVVHLELSGDFVSGIDKAKLYVDSSLSDEQRGEIDAIFHGEKGGLWGGMREAIATWLPSTVTGIEFSAGDAPGLKVDGAGEVALTPVKGEDGTQATLHNAPVFGVFGIGVANLAMATATSFSDPDLRSWESLGHGSTAEVAWTG